MNPSTFPQSSWRCTAPTLLGACDLELGDLTDDMLDSRLGCANGHRFVRDLAAGTLRQVEDVVALVPEQEVA